MNLHPPFMESIAMQSAASQLASMASQYLLTDGKPKECIHCFATRLSLQITRRFDHYECHCLSCGKEWEEKFSIMLDEGVTDGTGTSHEHRGRQG